MPQALPIDPTAIVATFKEEVARLVEELEFQRKLVSPPADRAHQK